MRNAVWDMMHWWMKQGCDGFRMDVVRRFLWSSDSSFLRLIYGQINFTAKAPGYPDAPVVDGSRDYQPFGKLSINRPKVHDYLKEMYKEVLEDYDLFWCVPPDF